MYGSWSNSKDFKSSFAGGSGASRFYQFVVVFSYSMMVSGKTKKLFILT